MTDWPSAWTEPRGLRIPAGRRVAGRLTPPPSKSLTHRAFVLALLAGEGLVVERPLEAEDTRLFRAALGRLGWRLGDEASPGGEPALRLLPGPRPAAAAIDCGNAGTMFRLLVAALATIPGTWRLDGVPRLRRRPVGPLVAALRALGADVVCEGEEGYAPLTLRGRRLDGGRVTLDAGDSSQFLSALLLAAATAAGPVEIAVPRLASAPYVELTLAMLERFGGRAERTARGYRVVPGPLAGPDRLRIEGDCSAACYPAAAAALTGGRVVLGGLDPASAQGDRRFFDHLAAMGAAVEWRGVGAGGEVEVRGTGSLAALDVDLSALPDQVPTLAALAPFARGTTRIRNVAHLRIKESDRLAAMAGELGRIGVPVEELAEGLVVPGVWAEKPPPAADAVVVDPHDDHRIAMSLALAGLRRPGVVIARPQVVAKSYPGFWRDLADLLARPGPAAPAH